MRFFRGTAVGVCSAVARLGMIAGTSSVDKHVFFENVIPKVALGFFSIGVSVLALFFLPERAFEPLKMSIDDERVLEDHHGKESAPSEATGENTPNDVLQMQQSA